MGISCNGDENDDKIMLLMARIWMLTVIIMAIFMFCIVITEC